MSPSGVAAIAIFGVVCMGVGFFIGRIQGLMEGSRDLIQTYRHLLDYGRPTPPKATVAEPKPEVEQRITAEIRETATHRLTEHLSREAGVSAERARPEAERLLTQFETWGVPPQ